MKKLFAHIAIILLLIPLNHHDLLAQDTEPADIYLEFSTSKYNDMSRSFIAKITSENEEGEFFVEGLPVQFAITDGEEISLLGEAFSDQHGRAELNIPDGTMDYPKDEEGYIYLIARFEGDDAYYEAEEELMVKDVVISIAFEEDGENKQIYFEGNVIGQSGEMPLADDDLYFYVPRMFSDMKIADGWFEEDGTGYIEFPSNIIGDSLGNVLVIARLEDHYDYGNVEVSDVINWAIPKKLFKAEGPVRELWTPIAPMWMIITLIIMLVGVWGHYMYAIVQLIRIKRSKK